MTVLHRSGLADHRPNVIKFEHVNLSQVRLDACVAYLTDLETRLSWAQDTLALLVL